MEDLPTFGEKWLHSRGNVGKYSLHGAFGYHKTVRRKLELVADCQLGREKVCQ